MHEYTVSDDFGFLFVPLEHPGLHGHMRLEVQLLAKPTYEHFDPESIEITAKLPFEPETSQLDEIVLFHPWTGTDSFAFCAGHIFIFDRKGKKIDAFTFGGEARIFAHEQGTKVVFGSPAPIFEVTPLNPIIDLFIDEVEILLAIRRAEWLQISSHLHRYEEHLFQADPMRLYQACLLGVEERLGRVYEGAGDNLLRLRNGIRAELRWLKEAGYWLGDHIGLREVI